METSFGQLVNIKRNMLGISMRELANRVKVDVAYISKIEKGKTANPSYSVVMRIAQELEINETSLKKAFQLEVDIETIIESFNDENGTNPKSNRLITNIIGDVTQIIKNPDLDTQKIGELLHQILQFHKKTHEHQKLYYVISILEKDWINILQTPVVDSQLLPLYYQVIRTREEDSFIIEGNIIQLPEFRVKTQVITLQDLLEMCNEIEEDDELYDEYLDLKEYIERLSSTF